MIRVKDLKSADVRYFDLEHNGMELTQPVSKVILLNRGDTYINLLNPGEIAPIYGRVENTTNVYGADGYFGTKITLLSGECKSGEAWLINNTDFSEVFPTEFVSIEEIENYVLESSQFYHNRAELIERRLNKKRLSSVKRVDLLCTQLSDEKKKAEMDSFFEERGCEKVYFK